MERRIRLLCGVAAPVLAMCFLLSREARPKQAGKADVGQIPKKVMDTLRGRFPAAEIHKWTRETEAAVLYDIEFTQQGRKFEADIKEDGVIENWEQAISARDLPAAVRRAVESKHPKSVLQEIMAVTAVKDGKDQLEGYEVVLKTADGKALELTVAPDGKILEDTAAEK